MMLGELIRDALMENEGLIQKLAVYDGRPAVFSHWTPVDDSQGWQGEDRYPRINLVLSRLEDVERKMSHSLEVAVRCKRNDPAIEEIEEDIINALHNVFFQPEGEASYYLSWDQSGIVEKESFIGGTFLIEKKSCFLNVWEYPVSLLGQENNPILAINAWTKNLVPAGTVIGHESFGGKLIPDQNHPACYWFLTGMNLEQPMNSVVWMNGILTGYVFAPSVQSRQQWTKKIADELALAGELMMDDGGPLMIEAVDVDFNGDYLAKGQIQAGIRFALKRLTDEAPLLNQLYLNEH